MHLNQNQLEAITTALASDPRIVAAYILGSVLNSHFRPDSDIDLALLTEPGDEPSQLERLKLAADLEQLLGHPVDIGLLSNRNLIYAQETITKGQCIFCRNTEQRDRFAATALSLYVDLKHERKEIEDAYQT